MPWVIGIDEAGYGPNLGPLVQACVGFFLSDDDLTGRQSFHDVFRKADERKDDRLIVDDSKKVYSGGVGFDQLERTILSVSVASDVETLAIWYARGEKTIGDEIWFQKGQSLPLELDIEERKRLSERWLATPVLADVGGFIFLPYLTATKRFNELVDQHGSKAAIVADRLMTLMREAANQAVQPLTGDASHPIHFSCDKLGGRHYYGSMLQEAFPDGWPVAVREGPEESLYRILNLGRDVTVSFTPRADAASVPVALASMLAKYLREVCMKQFNAFWQLHVPNLTPTAGYPLDAKRFYTAIRPAMDRLGLTPDQVWRKK